MTPFEQLPEVIFDLLAAKSYEQLSHQERVIVDKTLSAQEYDELHQLLLDFHQADEQLQPAPDTHAFPPPSRSRLTKLLHYPIPVYQVAAGVLFLIGSFLFLRISSPQTSVEDYPTYVRTGTAIIQDSYPDSLVFEL